MKSVAFRNKGLIDPRSIATFGVSSKDNDKAIGFFGTGLKYAIAILLRLGHEVTIWSGKDVIRFSTVTEKIRNDEFALITMNGERLGFTTELGKTWKPWQAFRELWCNCVDERGEAFAVDHPSMLDPADDETIILVTGEAFFEAWVDRASVILESKPIFEHDSVHIHRGASKFLFYRGLRVMDLESPSLYTYNIQTKMDLTEDRTLTSSWYADRAISRGLVALTDRDMIRKTTCAGENTYEAKRVDFDGHPPSEEWVSEAQRLAVEFAPGFNRSALSAVRTWAGMKKLLNAKPATMTPQDEERLRRAVSFVEAIGFTVSEYPIVVSDFLGENVLGRAEEGTIYLSNRAFMMGTKMLAGTLVEEYLHLKHQTVDESRGFQNFLIDAMMTLGEKVIKLEGHALKLALDIERVRHAKMRELESLQAEHERRMREIHDFNETEFRARWVQLVTACGLPEADVLKWGLNPAYLEDFGIAFLHEVAPAGEQPSIAETLVDQFLSKASVKH